MASLETSVQEQLDKPFNGVKIQIVTRIIPDENTSGAQAYLVDFISNIRKKGAEIELVVIDPFPGGKSSVFLIPKTVYNLCKITIRDNLRIRRMLFRKQSITDFLYAPLGLLYYLLPQSKRYTYVKALNCILNRMHEVSSNLTDSSAIRLSKIDNLATTEEVAFVKKRTNAFKPDVLIISYVWLAGIFDSLLSNDAVLKVILTYEIIHQRVASAKKEGIKWGYSNWDWKKEAEQLRYAQIAIAIQQKDAEVLKAMVPKIEVMCIPLSVKAKHHSTNQISGRCLFVGNDGEPNIYGLQWFLENSWPIILRSASHCILHVCGNICNKISSTFTNVRLMGKVDDLGLEYSAAEVCLAPLLFGSGLKIKLVEALSYGRACVSTSVGVQGLGDVVDKAVLVADTAEGFAESVNIILRNKAKREMMELQAKRYITEKLSPEKIYNPLIDRIRQHIRSAQKG